MQAAFARGLLSGTHWACSLLRPLSMASRPRNPYWCPLRWLTWRMGFGIGVHRAIEAKKDS